MNRSIRTMFHDIDNYHGDFGDGVNTGPYNPFDELESSRLSGFQRLGMSISMLCFLSTAIDNSTYESALASENADKARSLVRKGLSADSSEVLRAVEAFFESERAFFAALSPVYERHVRVQLAQWRSEPSPGPFH